MTRVTIHLSEEAAAKLTEAAADDRRSVAAYGGLLVERALAGHPPGHQQPPRSAARRGTPESRPVVPLGGQDAASGAGVEARRERPRCDPGRHPVGSKIGRACGACGQDDAWTK